MKKTLTVNISGIVFHIDEDAFERLNNYLEAIKSYFKDSSARSEIMADVEARIAELFQEKLSKGNQVISLENVNEMISIMGNPEVFSEGETPSDKFHNEKEASYEDTSKSKRLFRDPDDKVLGGVCSGIAAYFGIDSIWLRLGFAISFFVLGTGLLLYILLWIIIPKAKTTAEKLEMRGEKVNVSNIERTIKEELEDLKKKMKDFSKDVKNINKSEVGHKARNVLERAIDFFINLVKAAAITLGKLIGTVLIIVTVLLLIFFIGTLWGDGTINMVANGIHTNVVFSDLLLFLFNSETQLFQAKLGLALFLGSILIRMMYAGIRLAFQIKTKIKILGYSLSLIWVIGLILCLIAGIELKNDFAVKNSMTQSIPLAQPSNILYLDVEKDMDEENNINQKYLNIISIRDEVIHLGYSQLKLKVLKSETDSFQLEIVKSAYGTTKKQAWKRAENINYSFLQKDSLLLFNDYFSIDGKDKWRRQQLQLLLKVPVGKSIYFSHKMDCIMYDVENVTNTIDENMIGYTWIMTTQGLSCIDCK